LTAILPCYIWGRAYCCIITSFSQFITIIGYLSTAVFVFRQVLGNTFARACNRWRLF